MHVAGTQIVGASELGSAADRPCHRRSVEREGGGDLIQQFERIAGFAVHLVDEGDDGDVAQAADLEQLAGAFLDTLGGVDHHDGGIDRGERAVGVFREVLVAGRVEQVEDAAAVFEGHDGGDDRDAAFTLDGHPVGTGAAALALGADVAGKLDGTAGAKQVLGQGGLAGVGVGDDGEGAPAGDFGGERAGEVGHQGLSGRKKRRVGARRLRDHIGKDAERR